MKRLYTRDKWKRHSRKRQQDELGKGRSRERRLKQRRRALIGLQTAKRWERIVRSKYETVVAPENFSFINNPEAVIEFFDKVRETTQRGRNVFLDLSSITSFSPETVAVVLSKMADPRFTSNMIATGNAPSDSRLKDIFVQSGFYEYVQSGAKPPNKGLAMIHRQDSRHVEAMKAEELIYFATEKLYNQRRRLKGMQRVLLEAMLNTIGHASTHPGSPEKWWAMVYYDPDHKRAHFSFVDSGVGIFESIEVQSFKTRFQRFVGNKTNAALLKDILNGAIVSRTRDPRRGNGLPAINRALKRGQIENLIIVANDAYGRIASNDYRVLRAPFIGTFLYWEISHE
jgi:hypothetical protein